MNTYIWYAMNSSSGAPASCTTSNKSEAQWFYVVTDFYAPPCKQALRELVTSSIEWKTRRHHHVVWLWDRPDAAFGYNQQPQPPLQSFDDDWNIPRQYQSLDLEGKPCHSNNNNNSDASCGKVAVAWTANVITTPYWYTAPMVSPFHSNRTISVAAAWSNQRGPPSVRALRSQISQQLNVSNACYIDTTVTKTSRNWGFDHVVNTYARSQFCLVLAGDSPSSRRLSTCIVAGSIPIICSDEYVPPYPQLDWSKFSWRIPEKWCAAAVRRVVNNHGISSSQTAWIFQLQQNLAHVMPLFNTPANGEGAHAVMDALLEGVYYTKNKSNNVE
mmetsp:Transcript_14185/g.39265  ORF Transcript_14185/g.39265 Transcript_14185/m.39265 type:complete len:329 (+) Transcript_14185:413-1399(+)